MAQRSTVKKLNNSLLPSAQTAVYTAPSENTVLITNIILHNTDASPVTVQMWLVPTAQSPGVTYKFLYKSIPANETRVIPMPIVMTAADKIYTQTSTNNVVSLFIMGSELTEV